MVLRPQVQVNVNSALNLIEPAGPATIAMIGTAQWGPINEIVTVNSLSQALTSFKEDLEDTSLSLIKGLSLAYANGAGTVKCVRLDDGTAALSTLDLLGASTSSITIDGKYKGTYGDNILVSVTSIGSARSVEITDGQSRETYSNGGTGYTSNVDIVNAINANSAIVDATLKGSSLIEPITSTNLLGGANGESPILSDYENAIDDQLNLENFDILLTPGVTTDAWHSTIVGKLDTRAANEDRFSVYFAGVTVDETITTMKARTARGRSLALCAPSVLNINRATGANEYLDGSFLACAYAGKTAQGWPELSATHKTLNISGVRVDSSTDKLFYNNGEVESLLEQGIVPITSISGAIQPSRAVTRNTSTTEVWYEQNIVDIVNYVKDQVITLSNSFIGKVNLPRVRTVLAKNIDGILEQDKVDEVINNYLPTEVSEGASPDTVLVSMTIKPTFLINFITVTLTLDSVSE